VSFTALALHVAATWLILLLTGWALAPARVRDLPVLLRCLALYLCGSVAIASLGVAVVALDPDSLSTRALWSAVLVTALLFRWRRAGFRLAKAAPPTGSQACGFAAPLLLALAFGAHSLSVVHQEAYGDDPDWLQSSKRSYRLLDADLQYRVADAFLHDEAVEKHFLDGGLVWSAGDRPMLIATLYTALSRLLDVQNLALYRLTVILFAAVVLVAILALLRFVVSLPPLQALLLTGVTALHPFVYANIEYTWPKMTGVSFALSGFVLLVQAQRERKAGQAGALFWLGAVGLALAPLCHGTLIFGVVGLSVLAAAISAREIPSPGSRAIRFAMALLPTVALLGAQAGYNAQQTRSTQLGVRIALCSEGSALYRTPPMTLGQACGQYWARKGFAGFVEDRVANLKRLLLIEPPSGLAPYREARTAAQRLRIYHEQTLQAPLYSAGIASPFVALLCLLGSLHPRLRERLRGEGPLVWFLAVGWLTTVVFALVMSETSELTSRGVPFTQPVLVFVATGALALKLAPRIGWTLLGVHAALGLALLASDERLFAFLPDPRLLTAAGLFALSGLGALQVAQGDELDTA